MSDPIAVMKLNNGKKIVMRLRPDYAYNEVCSIMIKKHDVISGVTT